MNRFIFAELSNAVTISTSGMTIETAKAVDDIGAGGTQTITLTDGAGAGDSINFIINDQTATGASDLISRSLSRDN